MQDRLQRLIDSGATRYWQHDETGRCATSPVELFRYREISAEQYYRHELKPTVPMAMLRELTGDWVHPSLDYAVREALIEIASRFGYEVTE